MIEEFRGHPLSTFYDLPVFTFGFDDADDLVPGDAPPDVEAWAWRVGPSHYRDPSAERVFPLFLDTVDTARVRALLLGAWSGKTDRNGADDFQRALVAAADRFPVLEALFISDVHQELSEISWIMQRDPGDLLAAFPNLRVLGIRGRLDPPVEPLVHENLVELVIQSGGLPPEAVRTLGRSRLPALVSLDLYLGDAEYGGGATAEDLAPILTGAAFPELRHLGLRDAENADDLAAALAHAPVTRGLESLDLSLGTLGDEGAAALLAGQPLTHLKRLDLHHHYLSEAMIDRLWGALPDVAIDMSERMEPDELNTWDEDSPFFGRPQRYVAVAE